MSKLVPEPRSLYLTTGSQSALTLLSPSDWIIDQLYISSKLFEGPTFDVLAVVRVEVLELEVKFDVFLHILRNFNLNCAC